MMSVHCEKNTEGKQGFIDRFGWDPRRLQLLFLSDVDKLLADPAIKGRATGQFPQKNFKNMFSC